MTTPAKPRTIGLPVILVLVLLIIVTVVFLIELLGYAPPPAPTVLDETTYVEQVTALLQGADPQRGNLLLDQYACTACHRIGAENGIAPSFVGIAATAAERRPPLTAAAYLYESIINPSAYVVEGFPNSMAQDYAQRIPDRDMGDMIAFLLTPDAY